MTMRFALALGLVLALGSCTTLTEEECRSADWTQIGVSDGAEGRGPEHIEAHRRACERAGVTPDAAAWLQGRTQGLRLYCTPEKAYRVGRSGRSIAEGCTARELALMQPAHERGTRWHDIGLRIDDIEGDIRSIDRTLARLGPEDGARRAALISRRGFLTNRLGLLRLEQRRYATWP